MTPWLACDCERQKLEAIPEMRGLSVAHPASAASGVAGKVPTELDDHARALDDREPAHLDDCFHPRRARSFPRAVKIKMSSYDRKRPDVERAK
jgi:hypothetical protein